MQFIFFFYFYRISDNFRNDLIFVFFAMSLNCKFLNTQKLYSLIFSTRNFLNCKNDLRKFKMLHIFPNFANFLKYQILPLSHGNSIGCYLNKGHKTLLTLPPPYIVRPLFKHRFRYRTFLG